MSVFLKDYMLVNPIDVAMHRDYQGKVSAIIKSSEYQQSCRKLVELAIIANDACIGKEYSGIISAILPTTGLFLITPAPNNVHPLAIQDIFLVDSKGNVIEGSSEHDLPYETKFHLQSYNVRSDLKVIVHLYPLKNVDQVGKIDNELLSYQTANGEITEIIRVRCNECIARFAGICNCNTGIRNNYKGANVLLLENDEVVVLGSDIEDTLTLVKKLKKI